MSKNDTLNTQSDIQIQQIELGDLLLHPFMGQGVVVDKEDEIIKVYWSNGMEVFGADTVEHTVRLIQWEKIGLQLVKK